MHPKHSTNKVPAAANRLSPEISLINQNTDRLASMAPTPIRTMKLVEAETPNALAGKAMAYAGRQ